MSKRLENRVAIVTGSSRGIGREIALLFAREGCKAVVIAAKTIVDTDQLPGTIFSVAKEVCDELLFAERLTESADFSWIVFLVFLLLS
jgi:NAD(P)-dependent dehydrogenase (short-subunit alcohol dehydrogenase family)